MAADGGAAPPPEAAQPPRKKSKKQRLEADEGKDDRPLQFRNYVPRTPDLKDFCKAKVTSADIEAEIDKEIQEAIAAGVDQDAVLAIAPKKPNWDLKRDVERKMQVLQARTDRAVVQLIRQRIRQDRGQAPPAADAAGDEAERSMRDEVSVTLAREVAKAAPPRGADSDEEYH